MDERKPAYLMVLDGLDTGTISALTAINTLGSDNRSTIVLRDRRIAPHHASIYQKNGEYWLYGKDKTYAVSVNGKEIEKARLGHGDMIVLASTSLLYLEGRARLLDIAASTGRSLTLPWVSTQILHSVTAQNYAKILEGQFATRAGDRLHTLIEVSTAIGKIYDVDILLKHILSIVGKGFPSDRGFIMLITPDRRCETKAFFDRGEKSDFTHSKKITRQVLKQRASLLYNPRQNPPDAPRADLSCLSVPLSYKGKLIGLIQLEAFSGYRFTSEDMELLRKIAVQAALAVENLGIYQQPVRYQQHLISLERFSQSLLQHLSKTKIIEEGVRAAQQLFDSNRVSILLPEEDQSALKIACAAGIPTQEWESTHISLEGTLSGRVFQTGKPLLITNVHNISQPLRTGQPKNAYRSLSCILSPIQITHHNAEQPKTIGVICVTDRKDGAFFGVLERNLLALLSNQIGTALTNAELYEKATVDPLTKVHTRGYFFQKLHEITSRLRGTSNPLSLLMIDLDHFKAINDTYSHQAGDRVLIQIGKLLGESLEDGEFAGRYGGEEFVLWFKSAHSRAMARASRLQAAIATHSFQLSSCAVQMTCSIGVSTLRPTDTSHLLVERADRALYVAKQRGRNRSVSETELERFSSS